MGRCQGIGRGSARPLVLTACSHDIRFPDPAFAGAIIGDAPVLEYYAASHPDRAVSVVGAIFEPDKYGFALPLHHRLTRQLSVEIIGAHERGQLAEIRERYFGENP